LTGVVSFCEEGCHQLPFASVGPYYYPYLVIVGCGECKGL
jgi:hypothetical protein